MNLKIESNTKIELFYKNHAVNLDWKQEDVNLKVILPTNLERNPSYVFKITPNLRNNNLG